MKRTITTACCALVAGAVLCLGCQKKVTPPNIPQMAAPTLGATATAEEIERYNLLEEKRTLSENYAQNINRIQEINNQLIQLNMKIDRQQNRHY